MGILDWLGGILGTGNSRQNPGTHDIRELARRLGTTEQDLAAVRPGYREFQVKKRSGGIRVLHEPAPGLKKLQRCMLHKLLKRLSSHESVHGYEKKRSIVTNAQPHTNKDLVIRVDLEHFFPSTAAGRIRAYFRFCGWTDEAADLLTKLTTLNGGLPQGAPTSPRLANLVNHAMDARLDAYARKFSGRYTRYADDLTFSFVSRKDIESCGVGTFLKMVSKIVSEYGYRAHGREKLRMMSYARCQSVTGLVVNQKVALPRRVRKWLRAVEHHKKHGRPTTLSDAQLQGWKSLSQMVVDQRRTIGG